MERSRLALGAAPSREHLTGIASPGPAEVQVAPATSDGSTETIGAPTTTAGAPATIVGAPTTVAAAAGVAATTAARGKPAHAAVRSSVAGAHVRPSHGQTYVVRPGDSLWLIAKRLLPPHASSAEIARLVNRLWALNASRIRTGDPDLLRVGVVLVLPA